MCADVGSPLQTSTYVRLTADTKIIIAQHMLSLTIGGFLASHAKIAAKLGVFLQVKLVAQVQQDFLLVYIRFKLFVGHGYGFN